MVCRKFNIKPDLKIHHPIGERRVSSSESETVSTAQGTAFWQKVAFPLQDSWYATGYCTGTRKKIKKRNFWCFFLTCLSQVCSPGYRMEPEHEGGQLSCFYAPRASMTVTMCC